MMSELQKKGTTDEKAQEVLKQFMDLGLGVLTFTQEYGEYQFKNRRIAQSMRIDAKTGSVGMVGEAGTNDIYDEPDTFLADIMDEWKALEDAVEQKIHDGVEPKVSLEVYEACMR